MEGWEIRLIDEKEILGFRIDRLAKFLDNNKDVEDFDLMAHCSLSNEKIFRCFCKVKMACCRFKGF